MAGRLAMLGFALAVAGFRVGGKNVWEQFKTAPGARRASHASQHDGRT